MAFATAKMILPVNSSAAHVVIDSTNSPKYNLDGWNFVFSLVGLVTTEQVVIQVPRVETPDADTDAHWTPMMQDGEVVALSADNNVLLVPSAMILRLVKDAGVSSNAYGVRWM